MSEQVTGSEMIAAERNRQIESEGWTSEHDDAHDASELLCAARDYMLTAYRQEMIPLRLDEIAKVTSDWPWPAHWWKPSPDPIRNLVKAGALIAAEIDRLQRKKSAEGT